MGFVQCALTQTQQRSSAFDITQMFYCSSDMWPYIFKRFQKFYLLPCNYHIDTSLSKRHVSKLFYNTIKQWYNLKYLLIFHLSIPLKTNMVKHILLQDCNAHFTNINKKRMRWHFQCLGSGLMHFHCRI